MDICNVAIVTGPIVIPSAQWAAASGAVVDFLGVVRPSEDGRPIDGIDYECHPAMAGVELRRIAAEAAGRFELLGCTLIHRAGRVAAGEASLFLRVETGHRGPAYEASRWIVEQLKARVPIWKRPVFAGDRG
jgi:molybdopterin synthase catalytic subunit